MRAEDVTYDQEDLRRRVLSEALAKAEMHVRRGAVYLAETGDLEGALVLTTQANQIKIRREETA